VLCLVGVKQTLLVGNGYTPIFFLCVLGQGACVCVGVVECLCRCDIK